MKDDVPVYIMQKIICIYCIYGLMRAEVVSADHLSNVLEERRVVTTAQLVQLFGCSPKTLFRKLQQLGYITSYNKNRTGITLSTIPEFDRNGLWRHGPFRFSTWKTLNGTIQHMVEDSSAGLSAGELHKILHVNVYHHVSSCVQDGRIFRDQSLKPPVYYHTDPVVRPHQQSERKAFLEKLAPSRPPPPLSKENVIRILVAIIRHHASTVERLMPVLEAEGLHLSERSIRWVLRKYEIEKRGSP